MSHKKSIQQIGNLSKIIQTYQSVTEAASTTKISKRNITRCLTNPSKYQHAGNFKWQYTDLEPETKPSIWLFSFPDVEQKLIEQISINHKSSIKFLPKYMYLIHLVIAARGKGRIINASRFSDIVCFRNFDLILQGCVNAGVIRLIQGVQVTDEINDHGHPKRISSTYGLTKEYSTKAFTKVLFYSTDGKMIEKMIARNEAQYGVQLTSDNTIYHQEIKIPSPTFNDGEDHGETKSKSCILPILKPINDVTIQPEYLTKIETFIILEIVAKETTLNWYPSKQSKVGILRRLLYIHLDAHNIDLKIVSSHIEDYVDENMAVSS